MFTCHMMFDQSDSLLGRRCVDLAQGLTRFIFTALYDDQFAIVCNIKSPSIIDFRVLELPYSS